MKSGRQPPQPCNIPKSNTEVRMGILFVDPILNFNHGKESQFESHVMYPLAVTRQPVIWPATVDPLDWQNWPPGGQQWPTAVYPTVLQRDFDNWLWSLGRRPSRGKGWKRMEKGNMSQMTKQERAHETKPEDLKRGCPFSWMKLSRPRCRYYPSVEGQPPTAISNQTHTIVEYIQYIQYISIYIYIHVYPTFLLGHAQWISMLVNIMQTCFKVSCFQKGLFLPILSLHIVAAYLSVCC